MISTVCALTLAQSGQEMQLRGTPLFGCEGYIGDLRQYITEQVPPHWHPEMEFLVLDEGQCRAVLAGKEYILSPGDGFFVTSNALHGLFCHTPGACRYHSMVFDPDIVGGTAGSAFDTLYLRPLVEKGSPAVLFSSSNESDRSIMADFEKAFAACKAEFYGYEFAVREGLSRIIVALAEHLSEKPSEQKDLRQDRIKLMLAYANEHYSEPVTLAQLAAAANVCTRECERTFEQFLQISPMGYLLRRRCAAAAKLLVGSDLPVTEVGLQCGFMSPSYFAKQFGAVMGCSPRAFRSRLKANV